MPQPLYLPVSSLLSNTQQKKVSGVKNMLFAGIVPPTDCTAFYLLKPTDYELCRTRTTSSLWAHALLHKNTFTYKAIVIKKRNVQYRKKYEFKIKHHK